MNGIAGRVAVMAGIVFALSAAPSLPAAAQPLRGELVQSTFHATGGRYNEVTADFSKDRKFLLTGHTDRTARLWDVASGRKIRQFGPHPGPVVAVAFAPGGKLVATGSGGIRQSIRIWDITSGRALKEFEVSLHGGLAFIGDGSILASIDYHEVVLFDVASARELRRLKIDQRSGQINSWVFSDDGSRGMVRTFEGKVVLWDLKTGRELARGQTTKLEEQAALRGSEPIVVGPDKKGSLNVRRLSGATLAQIPIGTSWYGRFQVSPNGAYVLTSTDVDGTVKLQVWDSAGREVRSFSRRGGFELKDAIFSSTGDFLAAKDSEQKWYVVDVLNGRVVSQLGAVSSQISSFVVLPDGTQALATDGRSLKQWDLATGRQTRSTPLERAGSTAVSSDGKFAIVASSNFAKIVDLSSGETMSILGGDQSELPAAVALSPDSKLAYVADQGGVVRQFDLRALSEKDHAFLKPVKRIFKSGSITYMAVSPDGQKLLTGRRYGREEDSVGLWDISTGLRLATPKDAMIRGAFSPDGRSILAGAGNTAILADERTGQVLRSYEKHDYFITALDFSPDGRDVLTGSADSFAKIWDKTSGKEKVRLEGHEGWVVDVAYVKNGNVATAGDDGTIRLWDPKSGALLATMIGFADGSWMTITPEGFFDASSSEAARNLSIVRGLEVSTVDQVYNALYRPDLVREKLAGDASGKVRSAAARLDLDKVVASGLPPRIRILSPDSASRAETETVTVEAEVADQGGGIGKVEWRVNGVTLGVEERGIKRMSDAPAAGSVPTTAPGKTAKVSRTLGLTTGENRIAVLAYNEAGLIASEPAEIVVTSVQPQASVRPRLHVLAVGVSDYWDSALRLNYASTDAKVLSDGFRQAGTKLYERVEIRTVLDADATADKIDAVFSELGAKVRPQDVFLFFLAGHGKTVDARFYFLPQDFRYAGEDSITKKGIGQDKLQEWFSRIKAQKSVLLFDACESGSLIGDKIAMRGIEEKTAIDRMTRAMGRTMLTATTDSKPAIEGYRGHGVFTYTLLAGFDAADANNDGVIDVTELAQYVDRRLPDLTFDAFRLRQVPQMSIVGSNFPLASKVALLPAGGEAAPAANIPTKPTHVVIAPAEFFEGASAGGKKVGQLPAGTVVSLVKTEQGWVLVAREGKTLGYVQEERLARIQ